MILSIITINRNNAEGLKKTLASVASQTYRKIEHIIVDGASTDSSVEVIKEYEIVNQSADIPLTIRWISEPDSGIYNAMNKGIGMASGEYCQFLNSGDMLAAEDVTEKMCYRISELTMSEHIDIIYGNMLKTLPNARYKKRDKCGSGRVSLDTFFRGCLNHSPAYIYRNLFEGYGMYDESLRICSDWKFYVQSIVIGKYRNEGWERAVVRYVDIDVTIFDMTGISETNKELLDTERKALLKEMIPPGILEDYEKYHNDVSIMKRLHRHSWAYYIVWFMERVLFKLEKWNIL